MMGQARELGDRAAVHHHAQAGRLGLFGRGVVAHAVFAPDDRRPRMERQHLVHDRRQLRRRAEHIDHVDRFVDVGQMRDDRLAEDLLAGMTMKEAEVALPSAKFLRVHRSFIVSVKAITARFGNTIEIGKYQIPIGANYKDEVMEKVR